jgi:hypothetical protein
MKLPLHGAGILPAQVCVTSNRQLLVTKQHGETEFINKCHLVSIS